MAKTILFSVEIPVEEDGDIHQRLKALAERSGNSVDQELTWAVVLGINHHIRRNLRTTEAQYQQDP